MQIVIQPVQVLKISQEILKLSKRCRMARGELEDIMRQLRPITELDRCKQELRKQQDALVLLTARVVSLSSALREIAEVCETAEGRSENSLEGLSALHRRTTWGRIDNGMGNIQERMERILRGSGERR